MKRRIDIYFNGVNDSTYMYGARLNFEGRTVLYHNPLIPAGTVIHRFQMITDYDRERITPDLPMLERNKRYVIKFDFSVTPARAVYFKLNFFKRDGSLLKTDTIMNDEHRFIYPLLAHDYNIEIMSASPDTLIFRKMSIVQDEVDLHDMISPCMHPSSSTIDIFILQEPTHFFYQIDLEDVVHLENVYIVRDFSNIDAINARIAASSCAVVVSYGHLTHQLASKINSDTWIALKSNEDPAIASIRNHAYLLKQLTLKQVYSEVNYE